MLRKVKPVNIIIAIMTTLIIVKIIALFVSDGKYLNNLIWAFDRRVLFYDHFDHIKYCLLGNITNVYQVSIDACFPAFAYLFYGFLASVCSVDQIDTTEFTHVINTNSGLITLVLVYGVIISGIVLVLFKCFKKSLGDYKSSALVFCVLLSSIFLMTIASGNLTIGAMLLTLCSLYWRDSKSPILREVSMILLACAASLKVYPALWGLLYVKEKRFKETGRLILYGLAVFLIPFAFFGGVAGFFQFLKNLSTVSGTVTDITLVGILVKLFSKFLDAQIALVLARIIDYVYLLTTFVLVFLRKKIDWKTYAMFSGAMFIFNGESGSYCLIYWTIALTFYVTEIGNKDNANMLEKVYAVLFALSFCALPIFGLGSSVIPATCLYMTVIIVMIDCFMECLGRTAGEMTDE